MEEVADVEVMKRLKYLGDENFWKYDGCHVEKKDAERLQKIVHLPESVPRLSLRVPFLNPTQSPRSSLSPSSLSATRERRSYDDEAPCTICLSRNKFQRKTKLPCSCNATFHISCIEQWLESHNICPCCRQQVDSISIDSISFGTSAQTKVLTAHELAARLSEISSEDQTENHPHEETFKKSLSADTHIQAQNKKLTKTEKLRAAVASARRAMSMGERAHICRTPVFS